MRLSTKKSSALARVTLKRYGSWKAVREAAVLEDGVYVVKNAPENASRERAEA